MSFGKYDTVAYEYEDRAWVCPVCGEVAVGENKGPLRPAGELRDLMADGGYYCKNCNSFLV